jgi:hypothetical protein
LSAGGTPIGELIAALGAGVASAQQSLDRASLGALDDLERRGSAAWSPLGDPGDSPALLPPFYRLAETSLRLRVQLRWSAQGLLVDPADGAHCAGFGAELAQCSTLSLEFLPTPPPAGGLPAPASPPTPTPARD